jgi:hypothetical protein
MAALGPQRLSDRIDYLLNTSAALTLPKPKALEQHAVDLRRPWSRSKPSDSGIGGSMVRLGRSVR